MHPHAFRCRNEFAGQCVDDETSGVIARWRAVPREGEDELANGSPMLASGLTKLERGLGHLLRGSQALQRNLLDDAPSGVAGRAMIAPPPDVD
jgi:hypothetical protein